MPLPLRDREMTVEDLYVMPDDGFKHELQAGLLVSEPAPGFRRVWVVDPEAQTVTVYASLLSPCKLGEDETLDGNDVVPGFQVRVREIFEV